MPSSLERVPVLRWPKARNPRDQRPNPRPALPHPRGGCPDQGTPRRLGQPHLPQDRARLRAGDGHRHHHRHRPGRRGGRDRRTGPGRHCQARRLRGRVGRSTNGPLDKRQIGKILPRNISPGASSKLGIGQPTLVADHLTAGSGVLHTENGMPVSRGRASGRCIGRPQQPIAVAVGRRLVWRRCGWTRSAANRGRVRRRAMTRVYPPAVECRPEQARRPGPRQPR